ncbi:MAG TPA: CbiX/SirB N-terminal domain-containing protein [Thermodesulfobacteriota bacterium]|nr:CbiX/SirB N-terminal domain-containing protein [Thermodesulfobacteriota bacterium]
MKKRALILVDHGSVVKEANDMLIEVASMVSESCKSQFDIVRFAHMELAEPTIGQAFDACVADGADEIIVHPYFLAPGRHSTRDIPRMVEEAAQKHSDVSYKVTEPLGIHQKIVEVVLERSLDKTGNQ